MFRVFLFSFFILFSVVLKAETIKNDAVISILDYYNDSFEDFYSKEKGVKKIKEKLDNIIKDEYRIEQIDETNLFKVYNKNKHFYIFPEHDYIFIGKMLKLNDFSFSKVVVDSERKSYNRNLLRMFNESDAIIYKHDKKEKEGRIYVFADFSCPYCKKFHDENLNNLINLGYEVWYLPFLKNPNNLKVQKEMKNIFCLSDNEIKKDMIDKAFDNSKLFIIEGNGAPSCNRENYIDNLFVLTDLFMFKGTPAFLFNNGSYFEGFVPFSNFINEVKGNY